MRYCSILEMWKLTEIMTKILEVPICSCKCTDNAQVPRQSSKSSYLRQKKLKISVCVCCEAATSSKPNAGRQLLKWGSYKVPSAGSPPSEPETPKLNHSPSCLQYFPCAVQNTGRQEKELSPPSKNAKSMVATKSEDFSRSQAFLWESQASWAEAVWSQHRQALCLHPIIPSQAQQQSASDSQLQNVEQLLSDPPPVLCPINSKLGMITDYLSLFCMHVPGEQ